MHAKAGNRVGEIHWVFGYFFLKRRKSAHSWRAQEKQFERKNGLKKYINTQKKSLELFIRDLGIWVFTHFPHFDFRPIFDGESLFSDWFE
jgi:hypothetical protein